MMRAGFFKETVTGMDGNKKRYVQIINHNGIPCVNFYKGEHIIPIPYDFLVCHTAKDLEEPKLRDNNLASLERLLIAIQENLNESDQ